MIFLWKKEITQDYDAVDVGALFRVVEEAVVRKQFNITINTGPVGGEKETSVN